MKKHLFLNLFFGFFFFQIIVGAFAADLCENLSENACGQLFRGVQEWNERHGDSVKAIDWKYAGQVNDTKALANKLMDPKTTWVPHQVEENHIRAMQLSTIEKLPKFPFEQWKKDWRQELEWMLRRAKHVVNLNWKSTNRQFQTITVLGDDGIIYDSMLSNVRIVRQSSSCVNVQILWLWGGISGEIFIDLVNISEGGDKLSCKRVGKSWMILGRAEHRLGELKYNGKVCRMQYAWAWATPFADILFKHKNFEFRVSGIGSWGEGSGDCIK